MDSYHEAESKVYKHLLNRHKTKKDFCFSVRKRADKGAESDYFIGNETQGYFGFTLWKVLKHGTGSPMDLIDFFITISNKLYNTYFEFNFTKEPKTEQGRNNLLFGNKLMERLERESKNSDFHLEVNDRPKSLNYKMYKNKSIAKELNELLPIIDELIEFIAPIVDNVIKQVKNKNDDWKASRISQDDFNTMVKKLNNRIEKYKKEKTLNAKSGETKPIENLFLNQILYGPPGTGKTYLSIDEAIKIANEAKHKEIYDSDKTEEEKRTEITKEFDKLRKDGRIEFITFHQSYGYEEFIEGIKPVYKSKDLKYEIKDGVFKKLCLKALGINEGDNQKTREEKLDNIFKKSRAERKKHFESEEKYVIIIDEINRGNISKIFGELITLIEKDKRLGEDEELTTTLPYSDEEFGVPPNVYIIGTMNSADRSIALMDTALRRRFRFIEKMPETEIDNLKSLKVNGVNISEMLKTMNDRIELLYDMDHTIGHSYFFKLLDKKIVNDPVKQYAELCNIFQNEIIPLLQEYFYDDWEKIRLVLGEEENSDNFIEVLSVDKDLLFRSNNHEIEDDKKLYRVKKITEDITDASIFKKIYLKEEASSGDTSKNDK